jgi:hypothetical protein
MKATSFNVNIFVEEVERLEREIPELVKSCKHWVKHQDERRKWGSTDQYSAQYARSAMERRLMKFRHDMATVYDFMGDRGLVNFEPTTNGNNGRPEDKPRISTIVDQGDSFAFLGFGADLRHRQLQGGRKWTDTESADQSRNNGHYGLRRSGIFV